MTPLSLCVSLSPRNLSMLTCVCMYVCVWESKCVFVCVCVCACVCMHSCVWISDQSPSFSSQSVRTYTHLLTQSTYTHTHTRIQTHLQMEQHRYLQQQLFVRPMIQHQYQQLKRFLCGMRVCVFVFSHKFIVTHSLQPTLMLCVSPMGVCVYVCVSAYITITYVLSTVHYWQHVHTHTHTYTHIHTHIHIPHQSG